MRNILVILFLLASQWSAFAGAFYLEPLSASVNPIGVHLQWSTYKELDVSQFIVEKSIDGINYFEIGEEQASGFSIIDNKYHFLDMENAAGTFSYRLRELGVNGTISYSFIATAEVFVTKPIRILSLSLNEVSGNSSVTFDASEAMELEVYLTNIEGNRVDEDIFNAELGINTFKKEMTGFERGFYILHIEAEGLHERFTLWKEREVEEVLVPVASTIQGKKNK